MGQRTQSITPFKEGQNTNDHKGNAPSVKVLDNASKSKFSPGHDPLMQSLSSGIPDLPTKRHMGSADSSVKRKGVNYNPAGEFGRIKGKRAVPPTGMKPHTSAPGKNALGAAMNKVGQKSGWPAMAKKGGGGGRGA